MWEEVLLNLEASFLSPTQRPYLCLLGLVPVGSNQNHFSSLTSKLSKRALPSVLMRERKADTLFLVVVGEAGDLDEPHSLEEYPPPPGQGPLGDGFLVVFVLVQEPEVPAGLVWVVLCNSGVLLEKGAPPSGLVLAPPLFLTLVGRLSPPPQGGAAEACQAGHQPGGQAPSMRTTTWAAAVAEECCSQAHLQPQPNVLNDMVVVEGCCSQAHLQPKVTSCIKNAHAVAGCSSQAHLSMALPTPHSVLWLKCLAPEHTFNTPGFHA